MQKCHEVLQNVSYSTCTNTVLEQIRCQGGSGQPVLELLRGHDTQKLELRKTVWLVSAERFSSHCPLPTSASTGRT